MYQEYLTELIKLLDKADAHHWTKWFEECKRLYMEGKYKKSYLKVLGAYGGMGSFNDVWWRLPENEEKRHDFLKGEVWKLAKQHLDELP